MAQTVTMPAIMYDSQMFDDGAVRYMFQPGENIPINIPAGSSLTLSSVLMPQLVTTGVAKQVCAYCRSQRSPTGSNCANCGASEVIS